jgi:hypothetical protein
MYSNRGNQLIAFKFALRMKQREVPPLWMPNRYLDNGNTTVLHLCYLLYCSQEAANFRSKLKGKKVKTVA